MLVQQHLDFVEQHAPAAPFRADGQMLRKILAQCLLGGGEGRQRRTGRQLQMPAVRGGNIQLQAGFVEYRQQRGSQRRASAMSSCS